MPFVINNITATTDPVKFYECMSTGKPVVSVRLPELMQYENYVYFADDAAEFISRLEAALREADPAMLRRRRMLAQANSWRDRYVTLDAAISALYPKASLVIVTHNNADLTQQCIESLYRNTSYPSFEVIIVDNASTDSTRVFLSYAAAAYPNLRVILNGGNEGSGMRAARMGASPAPAIVALAAGNSDFVVFLSNDVATPPGWLGRLLRHLDDPAVGLVGPVSNAACNEAQVAISYQTWRDGDICRRLYGRAQRAGLRYHQAGALLRRGSPLAAGRDRPLDEQFELGLFEADDLAQRVRLAGYRMICAKDVFIHQAGEAASGKLHESEYRRIFDANRQLYEQKWQTTWEPHVRQPAVTAGWTVDR